MRNDEPNEKYSHQHEFSTQLVQKYDVAVVEEFGVNPTLEPFQNTKNILPPSMKQTGAGRSESTPMENVFPTFTAGGHLAVTVDALHVVEAGNLVSPGTGVVHLRYGFH